MSAIFKRFATIKLPFSFVSGMVGGKVTAYGPIKHSWEVGRGKAQWKVVLGKRRLFCGIFNNCVPIRGICCGRIISTINGQKPACLSFNL